MKKNIFSVRNAALAAALAIVGSSAFAAPLLFEPFNYTSGTTLVSNGWITASGTAGQVTVGATSQTYAGLPVSTGGSTDITETTETEDVVRDFTAQTDGGSGYVVYASAIVRFTALPTTTTLGNYFYSFVQAASTTNFFARTFARTSAGAVQIGIRGSSSDGPVYAAGTIPLNTPTLVVIKYQSVVGAVNDVASLWVNPALGGAEPAASATTTPNSEPAAAGIGRILLRQSLAGGEGHGAEIIDEIRIGTTWADVAGPTFANVDGWTMY